MVCPPLHKMSCVLASFHPAIHPSFLRKLRAASQRPTPSSSNQFGEFPRARRNWIHTKTESKPLQQPHGMTSPRHQTSSHPHLMLSATTFGWLTWWRRQESRVLCLNAARFPLRQCECIQVLPESTPTLHYLQDFTKPKPFWPIYLNDCFSVTKQTRQNGLNW